MWHICVRRGGCIGSWLGNWRERGPWGDLGIDGWNIRMDLQEVGYGYVDSIGLAQDRVVDACGYSNEPFGSVKCGEFLD